MVTMGWEGAGVGNLEALRLDNRLWEEAKGVCNSAVCLDNSVLADRDIWNWVWTGIALRMVEVNKGTCCHSCLLLWAGAGQFHWAHKSKFSLLTSLMLLHRHQHTGQGRGKHWHITVAPCLVSIVQFLRAILQQNFSSLLVTVVQNTAQGATQPQPLSLEDAALHPLTTQQVFSLVVSLQNLLVHVYLQVYKTPILEQHTWTNPRRNHPIAEWKESAFSFLLPAFCTPYRHVMRRRESALAAVCKA